MENYPHLVRAIASEGHEIGNHSYTHPHMTQISLAEVNNQAILNNLASLGYVTIMWTIDSLDWKAPGADQITARIVNNIEPGAIILMHQSAAQTVEALPELISQIKRLGYEFGTITQVLDP